MIQEVTTVGDMIALGQRVGESLRGEEVIELVGDVGAGKTTFVKGLALGLRIDEDIQSPSFTISRVYDARDNLRLAHYDFYRLHDPGIMAEELSEMITDPRAIVVVEWADIASDVLPLDRLTIRLMPLTETSRKVEVSAAGNQAKGLMERMV